MIRMGLGQHWDREMKPMTSARVLARVFACSLPLAIAAAAAIAVPAQAQTAPWPTNNAPPAAANAPWPSQPGASTPATLPSPVSPGMQGAPNMGAPGMMMGGPPPDAEQQKC